MNKQQTPLNVIVENIDRTADYFSESPELVASDYAEYLDDYEVDRLFALLEAARMRGQLN